MRVTVVGDGVVGLACGWRLTQRGADVTVVGSHQAGAASGVAAGMLAPVTEVHFGETPHLALALESARRWAAFADELVAAAVPDVGRGDPLSVLGHDTAGTLAVARDSDDLAALERVAAYQASLGLAVERLGSRACRELEPSLAPSVRGGFLVGGDHQVDPRLLAHALRRAVEAAGGVVVERPAFMLEGTSVRPTGGSTIDGDAVVLAAGAWTGGIHGIPAELAAVRPVKGQVLRLQGDRIATRTVRGLDCYVVPRASGEVVVGATQEERGFDLTVTAGAVHGLLDAAVELLPDVAELELVEATAGFRPGTPDNAPLLGPTSVDRVFAATGHFRNGILLAPVTADAVATMVVDGTVPPEVTPFSPLRFAAVAS